MVGNTLEREAIRIYIVAAVMIMALGFLGLMLWRIQVSHGHQYAQDELRQNVRRVQLPGMRGRIFDRHERIIVDNRPDYRISIYLEEIRQPGPWSQTIDYVEHLIHELSHELAVPVEVSRDEIRAHIRRRLPLPFPAWRDVDELTMARWAERVARVPGVDLTAGAVRVYPYGDVGAHLLGYVGRADAVQDEVEPFHYYLPDMEGKSGLERHLDHELRGRSGGELLRVDVVGYRHQVLGTRDPEPGRDVQLTIDMEIQRIAADVLGDRNGSIVVLDPRNGDVVAMTSSPGFDPNIFVPSISREDWQGLMQNPGNPLINRAVTGRYVPGSIYKPVVAVAALQNDTASPDAEIHCPGYFDLGAARFRCWLRTGHGRLNMRQALERSCNVYFYRVALQIGYDAIYGMSIAMGLGQKTGIDLDNELGGLIPNDAWKRRVYNDAWRDGDTCNVAIGQGPVIVTPLQMAVVAGAVANGGKIVSPRIVMGSKANEEESFQVENSRAVRDLDWSRQTVQTVRGGMYDAVMSQYGTGRRARVAGMEIGGKTGTAEYGSKDDNLKHAWMIGFAPYNEPRYAVAIVVDSGDSGGETAAPMLRDLMDGVLDYESRERRP